MQDIYPTSRLKRCLVVTDWQWWKLPLVLRWYVAMVPVLAAGVIGLAATYTDWHVSDIGKFCLLACCGTISVVATPRVMYSMGGGVTRDFTTVWILPAAILLPPIYAALMPIPLFIAMYLFVHKGVPHRLVFTIGSISLPYAGASFVFRMIPASFAGPNPSSGIHAVTWAAAVAACEIIFGRTHHFLVLGAAKLSNPNVRLGEIEWNREAVQGLFAEIDLAVLIALAGAVSPALVILALPTVLLVRRFIIHPLLLAQSRVDSKTGLLNVSTWEREAGSELSRSIRTRTPMAIALVDIDHFKRVNDTHGHLVGDRVLKALADALTGQLRGYDKAGRFGGEEFVLLLAQTTEDDACRIAERLRRFVADMEVPVSDNPGAERVHLTISIGVTAMIAGHTRELTDMLAAADSALYQAKQSGRNRVAVARQSLATELEVVFDGHGAVGSMEPVKADPAAASLGLSALP
jgi:diguanylate cyclase (GGDEF)-like protein